MSRRTLFGNVETICVEIQVEHKCAFPNIALVFLLQLVRERTLFAPTSDNMRLYVFFCQTWEI